MLHVEYMPLLQALDLIEAAIAPPRDEEAIGTRRLDFTHRAEGRLSIWIVGNGALVHRHRPNPTEERRRLREEANHRAWREELRQEALRQERGVGAAVD